MYRQVLGLRDRVALAAEVQEKQESQEICPVTDAAKTTPAPIEDDDSPAPTIRDVCHLAEALAPFLTSGALRPDDCIPLLTTDEVGSDECAVGLANGQGINSVHGKEADR